MDPITTLFDLNGTWAAGGIASPIISVSGQSFTIDMSALKRPTAIGVIANSTTISVTFPDDKTYSAKLQLPNEILWSNSTTWTKVVATIVPIFDLNGTWAIGGAPGPVVTTTSNSISIDMSAYKRPTASGSILDASDIRVTFPDDKSYDAKLQPPNMIEWANNTAWTKISASTEPPLPNLHSIGITFNTHSEDNKDGDTVLHVFIKNRSIDTSLSEDSGDFISNYLSFQQFEKDDPFGVNPYLATGVNLASGVSFGNNSSNTYFLQLRTKPIPCREIVLPVVNIHILPTGDDTWVFDFTVKFYFADPANSADTNHQYDFSFPSNTNGITGIVLGQDNRNYVGIGTQNPNGYIPQESPFFVDSVLKKVVLDFNTRGGSKDAGTQVNVHIVNRLSDSTSHDIAIATNLFPNQAFQPASSPGEFDPTDQAPQATSIELNATSKIVAFNAYQLQEMALPVVNIIIVPDGNQGRWMFDFRVRYYFSYGATEFALEYASTTSGIDLDANETKYAAVYQGDSFPGGVPIAAPFTQVTPIDHHTNPKQISLAFLQSKLQEFINTRQSSDPASADAALFRFRLDNSGAYGSAPPGNYYSLMNIQADPPTPGTTVPASYQEGVYWSNSVSDQGPEDVGKETFATLYDINSSSISLNVSPSGLTPLILEVDFETGGPTEIVIRQVLSQPFGVTTLDTIDITQFSIKICLTLTLDPVKHRVDVMSWVKDLTDPQNLKFANGKLTGSFLGQPVSVAAGSDGDARTSLLEKVLTVALSADSLLAETLRGKLRDKIFSTLKEPDAITRKSALDGLNAEVNSWLLGGVTDSAYTVIPGDNTCKVSAIGPDSTGKYINISYTGPQYIFQPVKPAGWPAANEFDPGALANIDHIVVLTMENRSFDHMLGYLSKPVGVGGMGRADIDGLKGGEINYLVDGMACPSVPFQPGDTVFNPDPPHSYDPVTNAINNGAMDRFAQVYAQDSGPVVGPNIMKYQPAANVPTYDELARDFAIGHRWFAAHPGPTFCNRFHELTGWLNIDPTGFWELKNSSPLRPVFTDTIFDHLTDAKVTWKYFEHHYCFLRFFERHTFDADNIATFDDPEFGFANLARLGDLPSVTFIDPHFIELPPGGNCDGPPADIQQGQILVRKVVEAVVSSPAWEKTLLLVTYDEHGGFYDHVPPPPAAQIAPGLPSTFGVRVPAFVISPWVAQASVFGHDAGDGVTTPGSSLYFDHTSILKTIAKRFLGNIPNLPPPYMGARYAAANDLSSIMTSTPRTPDFRPFLKYQIEYAASKMCLDVPGDSPAPNTALWVFTPNGTDAQAYSFEDAGDGYFYIRTHTGGLYLTATWNLAVQGTGTVTQEPAMTAAYGGRNAQRWKLTRGLNEIIGSNQFRIQNAMLGDSVVLQTAGNGLQSEAAVILAAPTTGGFNPNPWIVTSASLPDTSGEIGPPIQ